AMAWLPVRAWRRRRSRRPSIARGLISLLAVTGAAVVAFDLLWGFNYDRRPVGDLLGYEMAPVPAGGLEALASSLAGAAAELRQGLPEDAGGVLRLSDGLAGALHRAPTGFAGAGPGGLPLPSLGGRPKPVLLSPLMSYLGIAGIFIPFTGEANVNATLPDWELPFTACHALAHQRGFAREEGRPLARGAAGGRQRGLGRGRRAAQGPDDLRSQQRPGQEPGEARRLRRERARRGHENRHPQGARAHAEDHGQGGHEPRPP